jgi:hypothetical protein
MIYIGPPAPKEQPAAGPKPDGKPALPDLGPAWQAYRTVRKNWQEGDAFKKHYPQETKYRHSLEEELDALQAAAQTEEKRKSAASTGAPVEDTSLALLLNLQRAGLIEAYVLFSLGDEGIAHDYAAYRAKNRAKLEEYMDRFVVPTIGK